MSTDYRALCAELAEEVEHLWSIVRDDNNEPHPLADRAASALAQPEPEGPPMPVPGDAEGLAEVFWGRYDQPEPVDLFARIDTLLDGIDRDECHPDGGWWQTSDGGRFGRIKLRELKELIASSLSPSHPATQPEPAPTDEELKQLLFDDHRSAIEFSCDTKAEGDIVIDNHIDFARAVLALWGTPTIQPVSVSERPWQREGWCDAEGRCWIFMPDIGTDPSWRLTDPRDIGPYHTHSLPASTLPTPEATNA
jgi:hypothetical protein